MVYTLAEDLKLFEHL